MKQLWKIIVIFCFVSFIQYSFDMELTKGKGIDSFALSFEKTEDGYVPFEEDPFTEDPGSGEGETLADAFLTLLYPTLLECIVEYYGESTQFDLFNTEIVELARFQHEGENQKSKHFDFHVLIRVRPFTEGHNTIGMTTMTLNIKPDGVKIVDITHENGD
ncbi:DUF3888 domain-containing protein [Evansella tamaricis]|uniref:DUF3888 domain-containing protein n=1 Tax=Evansella tamaricis TaxID=2069301 RepID=A0ABS6JMD9_9BACI|nr:DUF3888 domain-containing protein [Evansella tamaricis]MBU9713483.1 DUF3888 domain-containing protein [Evansella tamaricis]